MREMLIRRKNNNNNSNNNNSSISSGNIGNGNNNIATVTTLTSIAATTITNTNPLLTKMGINKKDLIVLVKFISKLNSISITCRLEFYDNNNLNNSNNVINDRHYEITLSATCDNSLLTIWPFINDSFNRWRYTVRK